MSEMNSLIKKPKNNKRKQFSQKELPVIPDKRYFTISEVSHLCAIKAYVLRYWEQEFPQLRPIKRRGNRRYYQIQDILLVRQISHLLYKAGFTIEGARAQLTATAKNDSPSIKISATVKKIIADLETVLHNLRTEIKSSH
jgi:DNA-binding transcriptional MerR regulator